MHILYINIICTIIYINMYYNICDIYDIYLERAYNSTISYCFQQEKVI